VDGGEKPLWLPPQRLDGDRAPAPCSICS
jgi:hypothetical protein